MHFPLWPRISHISNIFDHKNKGTVALEPVAPSGARRSSDVYLLRRLSRGNNSAEVSFSSELAPSQGYTFCIPATLLHAHPSPLFSLFPLTLPSLLISFKTLFPNLATFWSYPRLEDFSIPISK